MSAANAVRLKMFEFKIFGMFVGVDDRRGEDYNPGLFFNFQSPCGLVEFKVSKDQFDNPPSIGDSLWIVGHLFLNKFSSLELKPTKIYAPNDDDPEPSLDDNLEGGSFHGIGIVEKSTFKRNTGETGYKHMYRGLGLLYQQIFDSEEEYKKFPGSEPIILIGRIKSDLTYKGERRRVFYTLSFDKYRRVRREPSPAQPLETENSGAPVSPPDHDNSKPKPERRQAPPVKEN